jgi:hypothetical protein
LVEELADEISPLPQLIYTKSLDTGEVPADWRTANVSPVNKKGVKSELKARPISLTSVCCKILEHIMQHVEENNSLYPLQHGFRKGRSCEKQLIEFVDDISKILQEGRQTDIHVLIMDFDKVNHSLLIHKLRYYGIDGKTTRWIQNWLEDRQQSEVLDGVSSEAVLK